MIQRGEKNPPNFAVSFALKNTIAFLIFCSDEGECHGLYNVSDAAINKNNVEGHNQ